MTSTLAAALDALVDARAADILLWMSYGYSRAEAVAIVREQSALGPVLWKRVMDALDAEVTA